MYARHAAERTSALAAAPQPRHVPHALTVDDALSALAAERNGLSAAEAAGRLARHGPNRLPAPPGRNQILRFLSHFHNVLIYVLIGAAAITAGLGHLVDTAVILAVVIANAIIGFIQEGRAEQAMDAIRKILAPRTTVLRDGKRRSIDSAEVVPGDIVLSRPATRSADLRLIEARGLRRRRRSSPANPFPPTRHRTRRRRGSAWRSLMHGLQRHARRRGHRVAAWSRRRAPEPKSGGSAECSRGRDADRRP